MTAALLESALAAHRAGRLSEAESGYRRVLAADADSATAAGWLGTVMLQVGRPDQAAMFLSQATKREPQAAEWHNNLGHAELALGRSAGAGLAFRRAVTLNPVFASPWVALSGMDSRHASRRLRAALATGPDAGVLDRLGCALGAERSWARALRCHRRSIALSPGVAEALGNFGNRRLESGANDSAPWFRRGMAVAGELPALLLMIGTSAMRRRRFDEGRRWLLRAIDKRPGFAKALTNLGVGYMDRRLIDDAERCFRQALLSDAMAVEAHVGLAEVMLDRHRITDAAPPLRAALALEPSGSRTLGSLSRLAQMRGETMTAVAHYRRALAVDDGNPAAHSNLLTTLMADADVGPPQVLREHRAWDERHGAAARAVWRPHENPRDPERRLRVAYLSADFGRHPVGWLLTSALERHDRDRFEVVCYSDRQADDDLTGRMRRAADRWIPSVELDDIALADRVRADGIDVLVDLAGHTSGNRLLAVARRPAPVQVSWIGYFATTGMRAIDAVFTDSWEVPMGAERWYVETVVRLPSGRFAYLPPDYAPAAAPRPHRQRDFVAFGSFNQASKLNDTVVATWTRIVGAVPGSRLRLKAMAFGDRGAAAAVRARFLAAGLDPDRLELVPPSDHRTMLAEYADIDIALDPFPYTGCLSTLEALWMGVPVIALEGQLSIARQSAAILRRLGLAELVAGTEQSYEALARSLAGELRPRMAASPVCDGEAVARAAEVAFRSLWRRWCETGAARRD
jgi:predicted O-linked N-acetylglucosamine transferase (SPINDLY family)